MRWTKGKVDRRLRDEIESELKKMNKNAAAGADGLTVKFVLKEV